jgi:2,3-diketo-5-methylthio-1-phosphopentane phosphatase
MSAECPKLYLLDIEGTVAPMTLVSEVLFPYARAHCAQFLKANADDAGVQADLELLARECDSETDVGAPSFRRLSGERVGERGFELDRAHDFVFWLMDRDRKSTALKSLQGKIWKAGFESGELKGTLFADVPPALERWSAKARVAIYSSGSVEAQQLLFRYSNYGDLTRHISAWFDTRTGAKTESASYTAIAAAMHLEPAEILFFSDVTRETDAAHEAGCSSLLVAREGNRPLGNQPGQDTPGHTIIHTFDNW